MSWMYVRRVLRMGLLGACWTTPNTAAWWGWLGNPIALPYPDLLPDLICCT